MLLATTSLDAGLAAAVGVVTGAFGAHGLRKRAGVTPDTIHAWESASHYAVGKYNGDINGRGADNGGANWGCEVTLHKLELAGEPLLPSSASPTLTSFRRWKCNH